MDKPNYRYRIYKMYSKSAQITEKYTRNFIHTQGLAPVNDRWARVPHGLHVVATRLPRRLAGAAAAGGASRRTAASWASRVVPQEPGDYAESIGGGASTPWSPEARLRRAPAAALRRATRKRRHTSSGRGRVGLACAPAHPGVVGGDGEARGGGTAAQSTASSYGRGWGRRWKATKRRRPAAIPWTGR